MIKPNDFVRSSFFFLTTLIFASGVEARVFSFKDSHVAAQVIGTGGTTAQGAQGYENTSGASTVFKDKPLYEFSGEFGFTFFVRENMAWRFGIEGIQSKAISAGGLNSSGVTLMTVDSQATVFNPNVVIENYFLRSPDSRYSLLLGAGYSTVTVNNTYALTATGLSAYSGAVANFGDSFKGTSTSILAGLGAEYFVFDNVTVSLFAAYRYMNFSSLSYADAGSAFHNGAYGAVTAGQKVTDSTGQAISLDMSSFLAGVMLRFYLPPL
jgi:hypothetical protein